MKKKSVLKSVTAITMALCLSSSMIAYASPSLSVDYSTAITNTGESRTFIDGLMGITYQTTINNVSDINATFRISKDRTSGIEALSEIQYGYIDGDKFICTYTNYDIYKPNRSNEGNMDADYPIFHVEQVQKDQQAGITDRIYVVVVDGVGDWTDNFFAYCFRFTGNTTATPAQQTEGWVQNATGWWWRNTDNTYPVNTWKEINGKYYYFGDDGYMLHDTVTPDGYTVGSDGAWIEKPVSEEQSTEADDWKLNLSEADKAFLAELKERGEKQEVIDHSDAGPDAAGYDGSGDINIGGGF